MGWAGRRRPIAARRSGSRPATPGPGTVRPAATSWTAQRQYGDLARREDPQRRSPEAGAPAGVELGTRPLPGQPLHGRPVPADQGMVGPDLPAAGMPRQLQVDPP